MRLFLLGIIVLFCYVCLVLLIGFEGPLAVSLNFLRVTSSAAVLILFIPFMKFIFEKVPPPQRDYLLAGIVCQWLSVFLFSLSNEAGKIWPETWDSSVFTNAIPGFFSLLVVGAGVAHFFAPDFRTHAIRRRIIAITIGATLGGFMAFVAPLFR